MPHFEVGSAPWPAVRIGPTDCQDPAGFHHDYANLTEVAPPPKRSGPALPDANPKTRYGIAKPPLSLIPGIARVHLAEAFRDGAEKYGPANWRVDPVSASTYLNAHDRHVAQWQDGEECDPKSGVHHLAHAAACLMILLDAQGAGTLIDDRPPAAPTADLIRAKTRPFPENT